MLPEVESVIPMMVKEIATRGEREGEGYEKTAFMAGLSTRRGKTGF